MNIHELRRWPVALLLIAMVGCGPKAIESTKSEVEAKQVGLYQKGKGILLPQEMKTLFELEVVEVVEQPVSRSLTKPAHVYRPARGDAPAAANVLVSTDEAKELRIGQAVALTAVPCTHATINGRLMRLATEAQAVLGQVEALVEFADPKQLWPANAVLTASFNTRPTKPSLVIPQSALLACAEGSYVYAVNGKHLTRTAVKAGLPENGFVEIEDGLYAGDSIAAKGAENLWFVELSALKGGTPCCPAPKKTGEK